MALNFSEALKNALLANATGGLKQLMEADGMRMYWYAGPVPTNADEALDDTEHTQVALITEGGTGDPLTFAASAVSGYLQKNAGETWVGNVEFLWGATTTPGSLNATFFRIVVDTDNGRGVGTGLLRMQGTLGITPNSDIVLSSTQVTYLASAPYNEVGLNSAMVGIAGL